MKQPFRPVRSPFLFSLAQRSDRREEEEPGILTQYPEGISWERGSWLPKTTSLQLGRDSDFSLATAGGPRAQEHKARPFAGGEAILDPLTAKLRSRDSLWGFYCILLLRTFL
jgi:hypothetical protein